MAYQSKIDFSDVSSNNSFMLGATPTDVNFGKLLNMRTIGILIASKNNKKVVERCDYSFSSLLEFSDTIKIQVKSLFYEKNL